MVYSTSLACGYPGVPGNGRETGGYEAVDIVDLHVVVTGKLYEEPGQGR